MKLFNTNEGSANINKMSVKLFWRIYTMATSPRESSKNYYTGTQSSS